MTETDNGRKPKERWDDLMCGGLGIFQDPSQFCFGMDAVLLSGFVRAKEGETLLDLGTGNGILPILLAGKTKGKRFTGLEIQSESVNLARRSVEANGLADRIEIIEGDIRKADEMFPSASFDIVTANPPYMAAGMGLKNAADARTIARHEVLCTLEDVLRAASRLLRQRGRCYFVHRPQRLVDLLSGMRRHGIEPKRMQLVYPFADQEPNLVLISGSRGGKPELRTEPPLIVYEADGTYTRKIRDIYGMP